jgi:nucleotide-binding universal stress UspA family protein
MATTNTQSKPNILVLVKLDAQAERVLAAAKVLAKKIDGQLRIMHVKVPSEAVKTENQFTAKKELYEDYRAAQKQLEALLKKMVLPKNYDLRYGNIKNNILEAIEKEEPQVIMMGQRDPKLLGLLGDGLIDAVMNSNRASVYIVNSKKAQPKNDRPTIGVFNGGLNSDFGLFQSLVQNDAQDIKYLSIEDKGKAIENNTATNHFVFTADANALKNLVRFTKKIDAQLFCIPKGMDKNFPNTLIHKLNTDVLMVR